MLKHFHGSAILSFAEVAEGTIRRDVVRGRLPGSRATRERASRQTGRSPRCSSSKICSRVRSPNRPQFVLPATSAFEKDGTFVNHAGLAQTFGRAVRPPVETANRAATRVRSARPQGTGAGRDDPRRTREGDARVRGSGRKEPHGNRPAVRAGDREVNAGFCTEVNKPKVAI